jgi:hypothetical protein
VECGPAAGHVLECTHQVVDLADSFLQQISETGHPVGEKLEGVVLLDVMEQHHEPGAGMFRTDQLLGLDPFVGEIGDIRMSVSTASGWCSATAR